MTLTEQWKKGELPEGDYFITDGDKIYPDYFDNAEGFLKTYNYGVQKVLAPVPRYEEWQELKEAGDGLSKLMFKSLMNRFVKADEEREKFAEENQQLKELLKECLDELQDFNNPSYPAVENLLTRINAVIGGSEE